MKWWEELDVEAAQRRLDDVIRPGPLIRSRELSRIQGNDVYLKLETLQRSGSFKLRGATNMIMKHRDVARDRGVITASAGNHAQGVALGALQVGCEAWIVMPEHTPGNKVEATRRLEANVILEGETFEQSHRHARRLEEQHDRLFVPPFDHPDVIEGQGTVGAELLRDRPDLDWLIVPVGGGGLLAGIVLSYRQHGGPSPVFYAVQSALGSSLQAALDAGQPVDIDPPNTVAEGIATGLIGNRPFELLRDRLEGVFQVDDPAIVESILWLLENQRQMTEGAGAAPLAAWRNHQDQLEGSGALVISGGNIDSLELTHLVERGLRMEGRLLSFETQLPDRPGALLDLSGIVAEQGGNIQSINHDRSDRRVALRRAKVSLEIEVRSRSAGQDLLEALEQAGYPVRMDDESGSV